MGAISYQWKLANSPLTSGNSISGATSSTLVLTEAFYWDLNDETRAWTKRFRAKRDKIPSMLTAGSYSSTLHYLKAVQAAGTDDAKAVMAKMRDMYLFQVKSPAESKSKDDIYKLLATVPGNEAYRPIKDGKCPFIKG